MQQLQTCWVEECETHRGMIMMEVVNVPPQGSRLSARKSCMQAADPAYPKVISESPCQFGLSDPVWAFKYDQFSGLVHFRPDPDSSVPNLLPLPGTAFASFFRRSSRAGLATNPAITLKMTNNNAP